MRRSPPRDAQIAGLKDQTYDRMGAVLAGMKARYEAEVQLARAQHESDQLTQPLAALSVVELVETNVSTYLKRVREVLQGRGARDPLRAAEATPPPVVASPSTPRSGGPAGGVAGEASERANVR
jgi:hypothetical protein